MQGVSLGSEGYGCFRTIDLPPINSGMLGSRTDGARGNITTVSGSYTQARAGTFVIGVSPAAIVLFAYCRRAAAASPHVRPVAQDATPLDGKRAALGNDRIVPGVGLSAHKGKWTGFIRYRRQVANHNGGAFDLRVAF